MARWIVIVVTICSQALCAKATTLPTTTTIETTTVSATTTANLKLECFTDAGCTALQSTVLEFTNDPVSNWEQCNQADVYYPYDVFVLCAAPLTTFQIYTDGSSCDPGGLQSTGCEGVASFDPGNANSLWSGACSQNDGQTFYYKFNQVPSASQPICSGGVGGDPITTYNGIEKKFSLPKRGITTLLRTSEIAIQATPRTGESDDEQWIGRVLVSSTSGLVIADINIRNDLESFKRTADSVDEFESIVVKAPWHEENFLKLPESRLIPMGESFLVRDEHFQPTTNVRFQLVRFRFASELGSKPFRTSIDVSHITPHNEGVIFETEAVTFLVSSVPAMEYYWSDVNDFRPLKYAHLDINFLSIKQANKCQGLLPELWGLSAANVSEVTARGQRQPDNFHVLRQHILTSLV